MSDNSDKENRLKQEINTRLEEHGFLANIRSQVRAESLVLARKLADEGKIQKTKELERVKLEDDIDPILIAMVKEFLDYYKLNQTKQMLDLELDPETTVADLSDSLPQVADDTDVPYLIKIIRRCRERHL